MNRPVPRRASRAGAAASAVALAALLSACSLNEVMNETSRIDYKSAGKLPPLEIPPDLVNPRGEDRYAIPDRIQRERTFSGYQSARATDRPAAEAKVLPSADGMRIERAGQQRWLVVNQAPDRLWPLMREFWQESGFLVQMESPETGILETDWAENRAKIPMDALRKTIGKAFDSLYSTGERDRFRMRLEPTSGGTEIYISHRGMVEVYATADKDSTVWQPRPSDPELEAEFLRRLMLKLGADQERAKAQVASAAPGVAGAAAPSLVSLSASGDALDVRESFDRAWRRVGLALDRGGFTVEDRDRSQGVCFVRYIDPEIDAASTAKPGFFARMFSSSAKARANAQQFRVKVGAAGEQVRVTVLGKDGSPLATDVDRKTGTRILALLREQLQ